MVSLKSDIFSCGMVLCTMILGFNPITSSNYQIEEAIENENEIYIKHLVDAESSLLVQDVVRMMTDSNPMKRPSAAEVLQYPWFKYSKMQQHSYLGH